jgi:hypothetical protein
LKWIGLGTRFGEKGFSFFFLLFFSLLNRLRFIEAFRILPDRFKKLEVVIGGRFSQDYDIGRTGNYMFRGFDNPRAMQRVLSLQNSLNDTRAVGRFYIALLQKMLGDEEWAKYLAGEDNMIKVLSWMTGTDGRCAGQIHAQGNCYAWFNCHDCKMHGMSGLCYHCATVCHQSHSTIFQYVSSGAYCDCAKCPKASLGTGDEDDEGDPDLFR